MSGDNGQGNGHAGAKATGPQKPPTFLQSQLESLDRPARMVGLFSARELPPPDVERLVDVCRKAMREEDPAASLTLFPIGGGAGAPSSRQGFRLEVREGEKAEPHDCLLHVFAMDDATSPHRDLLKHLTQLDAEMGQATRDSVEPAKAFLIVSSGRLDEGPRVHAYQNLVALFASALNALIVDPAAAMVTMDPGEWADAMEMSLEVEGGMKLLRR